MNSLIDFIKKQSRSTLRNYAIPGLSSYLLSDISKEFGCVRLFEMNRQLTLPVIPHSHRYDFHCFVLRGVVTNHLWSMDSWKGDQYQEYEARYLGTPGEMEYTEKRKTGFKRESKIYSELTSYSMTRDEIHTIEFSKDAAVLFFEGKEVKDSSRILLPYEAGVSCGDLIKPHWASLQELHKHEHEVIF